MEKTTKRIIGIVVGFLLWAFFFIQEEFAFYGIYSLISYNVHEISSFIPLICLLVTIIWLVFLIKQIIQKKAAKADKRFALLLVILLMLQMNYFSIQKQKVSATMVVTIQSVDSRNGTIKVINANGDEKHAIVLEAPDLFRNMVVAGEQRYLVSYDYEKNNPNVGRLSGLTILTKEVQEQAHFVSSFFDIYENSFD